MSKAEYEKVMEKLNQSDRDDIFSYVEYLESKNEMFLNLIKSVIHKDKERINFLNDMIEDFEK